MDHPHACGDKIEMIRGDGDKTGSSPRVWGQGKCSKIDYVPIGIIPTRVGTRKEQSHMLAQAQDHPHACGDKSSLFSSA